jgi:hypothetical protein
MKTQNHKTRTSVDVGRLTTSHHEHSYEDFSAQERDATLKDSAFLLEGFQ